MRAVKNRHLVKKVVAAAMAVGVVPVIGMAGTANAQGNTVDYKKATADDQEVETKLDDGRFIVSVWSESMETEIPSIVQPPAGFEDNPEVGKTAPVSYLINGAGGGEDSATWQAQSDVKEFMKDKNAWTVTPIGGAFSYYTDWDKPDPNVQTRFASETKPMKFETFLAEELPDRFETWTGGATGAERKRAISAISMTATSVLTIAQNHPGRFQFIGSYSGCAETSTPAGHAFIEIVTGMRGGANLDNMWGPYPGEGWVNNDPVAQAPKFAQQKEDGVLPAIYVSTGNGLPGPHESLDNWRIRNNIPALANQAIVGGVIEAATNYCTANLGRRFNELEIPAHFNFKPAGTHSWGYWQDDLHESWPMLAEAVDA